MDEKILIASIFLRQGRAVVSRTDDTELGDLKDIASYYNDAGIDKVMIFDLSDDDEEHELNLLAIRQLNRNLEIASCGAGNIKRQEDIKKLIYAGCQKVMLNAAKAECLELAKEGAARFGQDRFMVSIHNVDFIFKHQNELENLFNSCFVMKGTVLDAVDNLSSLPYIVYYEGKDIGEIEDILLRENAGGVCGPLFNDPDTDIMNIKTRLADKGLSMGNFKPALEWSALKTNSEGLIPCIVQDYKTDEVLMLAYMNEESYNKTIQTGKMTYYSRSRKKLWMKGEESGHIQFVKSLTADCDLDTILAKVSQVGAACHTGNPTCFFNDIVTKDYSEKNPLKVFEDVYATIMDRKLHPREGSYTNYLFDKGIDKILKKVGEEATEIVIAAKNPDPEEVKYEISDFLYHMMVLMVEYGVTWEDITQELAQR